MSKFTTCWTIHRIKQWSKNKGGGPGKKTRYLERYHISGNSCIWEKIKGSAVKRVNLHSTYWCRWAESPWSVSDPLSWTPATGGWRCCSGRAPPARSSEGTQGPRRAVLSIVDLGRTHLLNTLVTEFCSYASNFNKKSKLSNTDFIQLFRKRHSL